MNHQVIPAIIADNFSDLQQKINKVKDYVDWIQLDVMDGRFVQRITWYNPQELKDLNPEIMQQVNFEAHLMVYKPERVIEPWLKSGVKRIYIHYESTHRKAELIEQIKRGKPVASFVTERKAKDERILKVWLTVTRLMDDAGKINAIATTERDLSQLEKNVNES